MVPLTDVLAENNRLGELDKISDTFDDIMAAVRGEVKATITTAEVRFPPPSSPTPPDALVLYNLLPSSHTSHT